MRKLVVVVIVMLAIFTFIREMPSASGADAASVQNAAMSVIGQN